MILDKYIYPIKCSDTDGVGVLICNYFVTAGHVIESAGKSYVTIDNKVFELTRESALVFRTNYKGRHDGYDIAIFKFEDVNPSPLVLGDSIPRSESELKSICYNHKSYGTTSSSNIFHSKSEETWELVQSVGHIVAQYGNYIESLLSTKNLN